MDPNGDLILDSSRLGDGCGIRLAGLHRRHWRLISFGLLNDHLFGSGLYSDGFGGGLFFSGFRRRGDLFSLGGIPGGFFLLNPGRGLGGLAADYDSARYRAKQKKRTQPVEKSTASGLHSWLLDSLHFQFLSPAWEATLQTHHQRSPTNTKAAHWRG